MGLHNDCYARVWQVEDKGKYSTARVTVSRKNKDGTYVVEFNDGYVRLVGQAHTALQGVAIGEKGISVKVSSCDVTNVYTAPDGKVSYAPHYAIFGLELQDGNNKGNNSKSTPKSGSDETYMNVPDGVTEDLPFN